MAHYKDTRKRKIAQIFVLPKICHAQIAKILPKKLCPKYFGQNFIRPNFL